MTRWFRHYGGMMRDEKLVRVAVKASQPVERVMWVWGAILESASELNDGGKYDFDADEGSYFLRCDLADIRSILDGLEASGRVADGVVIRWRDRQFDSDSSKERQQRYREKRKSQRHDGGGDGHNDDDTTSRDGGVTVQEDREQITEDTSSLRSDVVAPKARKEPTPKECLAHVLDEEHAQAVVDHRKRIGAPLTAYAAKRLSFKFHRGGIPGIDANAAADMMIENGWQGFEWDWVKNRTGRQNGTGPPRSMSAKLSALCDQPIEKTYEDWLGKSDLGSGIEENPQATVRAIRHG